MSDYAGNPASYPTAFPLLSDGTPPAAAQTNVPIEALGDRTANLKARVDEISVTPALGFVAQVTLATVVDCMKYDAFSRKWMGLNAQVNDMFLRTTNPAVWSTVTEISGGALTTRPCWDFDIDPAGNVLVVDDQIDGTKACTAAGVWTKVTGAIGNDPVKPNLVYDPVSTLWCVAFRNSGSGVPRVRTSTNRGTSWTIRTTPVGIPTPSEITLGTNKTGRIVMQAFSGTNGYFAYSDDGGVTWSAATTHALGFTAVSPTYYNAKPIWNGTHWLAKFNDATGCKVFSSPDGATWTAVATLANTPIRSIAALGALWCGITTASDIVYSTDAGVTWRGADTRAFSAHSVYSNHLRFIATGGSFCYIGPGIGRGGAVLA